MSSILVIVALILVSLLSVNGQSLFPDCKNGPLAKEIICNPAYDWRTRAMNLVSLMNASEKIQYIGNDAKPVSRLGLPEYQWWSEGLHGVASSPGVRWADKGLPFSNATSFPQPINTAAAFNRVLVRNIASVVSTEARAFNNVNRAGLDYWTPNINIFRDPRWGRGQETPGEDPYLSSEYVFALITGLQQGEDSRYYKIVADCKHYAGYDIEDWHGNERYAYNAIISSLDLVETYLPPFESCVKDAKVGSIMCSYNAVNGVPSCANDFLLGTIARDEYLLEGWVTSDCDAVSDIYSSHHYTPNATVTVQVALRAGCDTNCGSFYQQHGQDAYNQGLITDDDLDRALVRLFGSLVRLGYFDDPSTQPYRQYNATRVNTPESQKLALTAALQSITLLKNANNHLPFDSSVKNIALIGPNAAVTSTLQGNYQGVAPYLITYVKGLQNLGLYNVVYAQGCEVNSTDTSGFQAAITAAQNADRVVYVGGINETVESEGHDRDYIDLPGVQWQLIQQLEKASKAPITVAVMGGGQVDLSYAKTSASTGSILWLGYPSQSAGDALAAILSGAFSPSGRLVVTQYPADYVNEVPMTDQSMRASSTNPGRTYRFYTGTPVYSFGHGLSYTSFSYSWDNYTTNAKDVYNIDDLVTLYKQDEKSFAISYICNVTNIGKVTSDVSVLGFVNSTLNEQALKILDVSPPLNTLYGFDHVTALAPGQTVTVNLFLSTSQLLYTDYKGDKWMMPGQYRVHVGSSTESVLDHSFTIVGEPVMAKEWNGKHWSPDAPRSDLNQAKLN